MNNSKQKPTNPLYAQKKFLDFTVCYEEIISTMNVNILVYYDYYPSPESVDIGRIFICDTKGIPITNIQSVSNKINPKLYDELSDLILSQIQEERTYGS